MRCSVPTLTASKSFLLCPAPSRVNQPHPCRFSARHLAVIFFSLHIPRAVTESAKSSAQRANAGPRCSEWMSAILSDICRLGLGRKKMKKAKSFVCQVRKSTRYILKIACEHIYDIVIQTPNIQTLQQRSSWLHQALLPCWLPHHRP